MSLIDNLILVVYFVAMIWIGLRFYRSQSGHKDFFTGKGDISPGHIGCSVVATDVGGGFSIGLGGLGFTMGLSASWLLFTGLIGAWLSAVILIPKVKPLGDKFHWTSFGEYLCHRFDRKTQIIAAIVAAIGYAGFVGAQLLAGGKLVAATYDTSISMAVLVMTGIVVLYTCFGGIQAVIYTDTIQWFILLLGLVGVVLPVSFYEIGGFSGLRAALPSEYFSFTNIAPMTVLSWMVTIIPIWFVANTLYQRVYASKDVKSAQQAWYLAGLLEWPVMAVGGAALGMIARVHFPSAESEMALPMLIKSVLPVGVVGIVLAAYFSAIMSTADSCLLASVGHLMTDLYRNWMGEEIHEKSVLKLSRIATIVIAVFSVAVALAVPKVLDIILLSYGFMVAGLFVPTIMGLLWERPGAEAAFWSIVLGGICSVVFNFIVPISFVDYSGLDPISLAMAVSLLVFLGLTFLQGKPGEQR